MSDTRYCRRCKKQTQHDHITDIITADRASPLQRMLWGIVTVGVSELFSERQWECQECGDQTDA